MRGIEFLTRPGCELCDDSLPRVRLVCRLLGRRLEVVDITRQRELESEYHLRIPVLRNQSGEVLAEGSIDWRAAYMRSL